VPSMASGSTLGRRVRRLLGGPLGGEPLPRSLALAAVAALLGLALLVPGVRAAMPPQEAEAAPAAGEDDGPPPERTVEPSRDPNHGWVIVGSREDGPSEGTDVAGGVGAEGEVGPSASRQRELRREIERLHRALERERQALHRQAHRLAREAGREVLDAERERERAQRDAGRQIRDRERDEARRRALREERRRGRGTRALREAEQARREALADLDVELRGVDAEVAAELAHAQRQLALVGAEVAREVAAELADAHRELAELDTDRGREVAAELARSLDEMVIARHEMERVAEEVTARLADELASEDARGLLSADERARIEEEVAAALAVGAEEMERAHAEIARALEGLPGHGGLPETDLWRLERELERLRRELGDDPDPGFEADPDEETEAPEGP